MHVSVRLIEGMKGSRGSEHELHTCLCRARIRIFVSAGVAVVQSIASSGRWDITE